jgi:hypothetical protein
MRATMILEKYTNRKELLDMVNRISEKNKKRYDKAISKKDK